MNLESTSGVERGTTVALDDDLPFEQLGHFQVVTRIGRGGMGHIYLGYETALDRWVAIKVLNRELAAVPEFVRLFRAEATAAAKLIHPHVIQIHFIGQDAGHHFFAMQYVDGISLARLLLRRRLSVGEALCVAEQALAGLGAAHALGMVHRDIKPGNIVLDEVHKRALLADFGLVKSLENAVALESTDTVVGTANYVSPEQGNAEPVDARSDLYSFGVVLYEMLAGQVPFKGSTSSMTILKHIHEPLPRLARVAPQIPKSLAAVVDKLLAKHPDERYQTVDEVVGALKALSGARIWPGVKADPKLHSAGKEAASAMQASPQKSVITIARGLAARLGSAVQPMR
jgi:serine/threonine protein kinase